MEDTWQVKSGSAWPHLPPPSSLVPPLPPAAAPMPDSANQMGLNSLQFSRSFVQKTNLRDNAAVREPMVFNTLNLDSCKSGKGELANSFLGLISGDSHHVSSGVLSLPYSSSLSTKLRVCDGGIVSSASFGVPNTSIPPLLEAHGNDVMGNGRRSPFVASRPLSTFTSNKSPFLHSNFQVVASPRHDIDSCKLATHQAFQGNVAGSEAISSRHGLPTMPSSLNTNQQHTLNWKSEKMPLEAKPSISSHSSTFQGRPHVFCMNKGEHIPCSLNSNVTCSSPH